MEQKPEDLPVSHRSPDTLASEEIHPLMELAVEMRQRATDQFAKSVAGGAKLVEKRRFESPFAAE